MEELIIVGAGLSGLASAHFLESMGYPHQPLLLEASSRPGGVIRSFCERGYLAEWGPHGFLDNNPASRRLLAETGLEKEALKAPLASNVRYLCHRGKLTPLPQNPLALLKTPLLSLGGKLRLAAEIFQPPLDEGHSVEQWAAHRFGPGVLPMVDAAVTGTFAGDYRKLSIDAVMPGARRLEREYGSLLRGLIKERKEKGKGGGKGLPAMTSFPLGMEHLVKRLSHKRRINFNCPVDKITPDPVAGGGWELSGATGSLRCKRVILALPVNQALKLLAAFTPPVAAVPEARIATVALGFAADGATLPPGFGYLAPEREGRFTLGALFSSNMFPQRAPEGHLLLEALAGGRRHPQRLELDDQSLIDNIYHDLRQLLPLTAPPVFTRVLRGGGIPQLEKDHPRLLAWRDNLARHHPELILTGFGWDGIGMNDMMKAAEQSAKNLLEGSGLREEEAVRPVYF